VQREQVITIVTHIVRNPSNECPSAVLLLMYGITVLIACCCCYCYRLLLTGVRGAEAAAEWAGGGLIPREQVLLAVCAYCLVFRRGLWSALVLLVAVRAGRLSLQQLGQRGQSLLRGSSSSASDLSRSGKQQQQQQQQQAGGAAVLPIAADGKKRVVRRVVVKKSKKPVVADDTDDDDYWW
jgi:hypothetical protein